MKVMWVSMDGLKDPFVEYTREENEWTAETTLSVTATTATYYSPQNWSVNAPNYSGPLKKINTNVLGIQHSRELYMKQIWQVYFQEG